MNDRRRAGERWWRHAGVPVWLAVALLAGLTAVAAARSYTRSAAGPGTLIISPDTLRMTWLGETGRLTATGLAANDASIHWTTSEASIAPVDSLGHVIACDTGQVTISATHGHTTALATLVVRQVPTRLVVSADPPSDSEAQVGPLGEDFMVHWTAAPPPPVPALPWPCGAP